MIEADEWKAFEMWWRRGRGVDDCRERPLPVIKYVSVIFPTGSDRAYSILN